MSRGFHNVVELSTQHTLRMPSTLTFVSHLPQVYSWLVLTQIPRFGFGRPIPRMARVARNGGWRLQGRRSSSGAEGFDIALALTLALACNGTLALTRHLP